MISASFDAKGFEQQLRSLSRANQLGALSRALTRTQQTMRKTAVSEVQSELNLKSGPIRDVVKAERRHRSAASAEIRIIAKDQPIKGFRGTRWVRRQGVSVKIKKVGARKIIRSGFEATMRSGHTDFFRRKFKGGKQVGRLPIEILRSTSPRETLDERPRTRRILEAGSRRFRREFQEQIRRRLSSS